MFEIIPAIDLIEGKCVRLSQGDFASKKIYYENPLEIAKEFDSIGLKRLHIVDLDGAKNGAITNLKVLENIARQTNLTIDFGGGIKTDEDVQAVFDGGAKMASIGSVAVKKPEMFFAWLEKYGSQKILLGADVRDGNLAINGWQTATETKITPFLENYYAKGGKQVFCTDISKDGLLQGSANALYGEILACLPELNLIASGGVGSLSDVWELKKIGCSGVIIGKAIYEGKITLKELATVNANQE
ncbi:MAG: 1-(5-phosphoribosyl)-5-[(5-phosphoribosylamino)methylideneamino]imidazole-4-carboxamide isomerase [Pyrinomonadaceae bacterium]|nr:1-(5-phosphoribosyl)-5-[(5-phosphoribosylamino)methylideneamino]imidazole-4-carboxamide isomerase [Pyrinomonadaceae bacterium]